MSIYAPETSKLLKELSEPRRFLMIDDDPAFISLFSNFSSDFNCRMESALSYNEGIAKCAHLSDYDFIWLDLKLNHGRRGSDAFREIKAIDKFKPIIICSGAVLPEEIERCSRIGVGHFVLKPTTLDSDFVEEVFASFGICRNVAVPVGSLE